MTPTSNSPMALRQPQTLSLLATGGQISINDPSPPPIDNPNILKRVRTIWRSRAWLALDSYPPISWLRLTPLSCAPHLSRTKQPHN